MTLQETERGGGVREAQQWRPLEGEEEVAISFSLSLFFFFFLSFCLFQEWLLWHMEVPRLGVSSEL